MLETMFTRKVCKRGIEAKNVQLSSILPNCSWVSFIRMLCCCSKQIVRLDWQDSVELVRGKGKQFFTHSYILLEKAMATHSSTLSWKIQWTEEPSGQQSMGSLRVGQD